MAIAAGSRIAVRLIAAFQASSRRACPSIAARASAARRSPRTARPASRASWNAAGSGGQASTRVGSGSRGRSRHPSCWSCLRGPSGLRSRRRLRHTAPWRSVFHGSSGSRPGFPVPLASPGTRGGFRCGCRTLGGPAEDVNRVIHELAERAGCCGKPRSTPACGPGGICRRHRLRATPRWLRFQRGAVPRHSQNSPLPPRCNRPRSCGTPCSPSRDAPRHWGCVSQ